MNNICRLLAVLSICCGLTLKVQATEAPQDIDGAVTVTTAEAQILYEQGAMFIDVRRREKWNWGHIVGARHFGLRSTFKLLRHEGFVERSQPIVLYSDGPHTMRGALGVFMARAWGYTHVYYYRDGYFSWLAQDLPVQFRDQPERAPILSSHLP
ncbi:rhodanese-like domain-containing protein [Parendozoicomonas haliclonae]|uniref:Molybdopterin biosynthesis protein MoeB n=1 Tax=Parendozoicomonas haliclonae TaxID=1960125 RepID=A0A1X7AH95_9GAMM|nr:rhodanese-like domain-containing protein [Parendozoicomonas haliclonae]SMA41932.1 molybdopterin biosynthesis protein MoeB [Parendozoicomonas haliclonae]